MHCVDTDKATRIKVTETSMSLRNDSHKNLTRDIDMRKLCTGEIRKPRSAPHSI